MDIATGTALIFAPFAVPICLYVGWSDMRAMKIYNGSVLLLAAVFVVLGPLTLPLDVYGWRLATMVAVLVIGILANAAGLLGAGDAKFTAAAAPFIAPGDLALVLALLAAVLLAAWTTHRAARLSPLRRLAPDWESWNRHKDFPMGLALGGTLGLYLLAGIFLGS